MDPYVEPHLTWRLLESEDLRAVEDLRHQLDTFENSVLYEMTDSVVDLAPRLVPGLAVGGWDAYDSLSAYGLGYVDADEPLRIVLTGGVHPARRNQAIGSRLLGWQVTAAQAWRDEHRPREPLWLGCYSEVGRAGLERIAQRLGFTPERYFYDLQRDLHRPVTPKSVPGVAIVPFRDDLSEAVLDLHNRCFVGLGGVEVPSRVWRQRLAEASFRPDWSFVAISDDQIVGYAMSGEEDSEGEGRLGWTERFGVHPDYRRQGIALSLLGTCLAAMRVDGCAEAGIGVDTVRGEGIRRLCEELGYVTRDAVALLSKVVA